MLALIWVQTVWHSDSVPERFFFFHKVNFENTCSQQKTAKA